MSSLVTDVGTQFLRSFDLLKSKVAEDALLSVFVTRTDVFDNVEFKGMSICSHTKTRILDTL